MRNRISVALLAVVLSACATGPTRQFVRTGPNHDAILPNLKTVAVVADVCLLRDVSVGDRYWSIKDSRDAEQCMIDSARTVLINKGYDVASVEAPFVGAYMNPANTLKFAIGEGEQLKEMHPPLFVAEGIATDPTCRQSFTTVIPKVLGAVAQRSKPPSDICCTDANTKEAINTIGKCVGGDSILFLVGQGVIVPAGKSVAQGVATGVLTTALTLGMFTYAKWSVSYLDTYAAFLDAGTGEIIWSNSLRLKGSGFTDKDYYSEKWPYNILYHIPASAQLKTK
jgi:hypothetical protein